MTKEDMAHIQKLFEKRDKIERQLSQICSYTQLVDIKITQKKPGISGKLEYSLGAEGVTMLTDIQQKEVVELTKKYVGDIVEAFQKSLVEIDEELDSIKIHKYQ